MKIKPAEEMCKLMISALRLELRQLCIKVSLEFPGRKGDCQKKRKEKKGGKSQVIAHRSLRLKDFFPLLGLYSSCIKYEWWIFLFYKSQNVDIQIKDPGAGISL